MEDMLFDQVRNALTLNGISVTPKGLFRTANNGRQVPADAGMVFTSFGVQAQEFMDEFRRRSGSAVNEALDVDAPVNANNRYGEILFIHPGIGALSDWSTPDRKVFSRFRFAMNEIDGSMIILLDNGTGSYSAIPMAANPVTTLRTLTAMCSTVPATEHDKYGSLYDELTAGYRATLQSIVDRWREKEFTTQAEFVAHLGAHVPHSMLKRLSIKLMVETVTKNVTVDGNTVTREYNVPLAARLMQQFSEVGPLEFLVKFSDVVSAMPEMQAPMPRIYSNDPKVPALRFIDLDTICEEGPCPTWDKYMERYPEDERDAFMAFTWSIFDAKNDGRQSLYIFDRKGFSGKTAVLNCIADELGTSMCTSLQKDSLNNQFSLAKVWDKRLVTIGDNKNPRLMMSEKMHMMTGHDFAEIEMKGRNSFHARLETRIIASGNIPLEIHPDARHETSRVIMVTPVMTDEMLKEFCEVDKDGNLRRRPDGEPVFRGDREFKNRLKSEFHRFLRKCREVYSRMCPSGTEIIISDRMYEELLSHSPIDTYSVADFFDTYFEYAPGFTMPVREFTKEFNVSLELYVGVGRRADCPITADTFREYVTKKYPDVRFGVPRKFGGRSARANVGIRVRKPDDYPTSSDDSWKEAV
jgi:hypothetical protein